MAIADNALKQAWTLHIVATATIKRVLFDVVLDRLP